MSDLITLDDAVKVVDRFRYDHDMTGDENLAFSLVLEAAEKYNDLATS